MTITYCLLFEFLLEFETHLKKCNFLNTNRQIYFNKEYIRLNLRSSHALESFGDILEYCQLFIFCCLIYIYIYIYIRGWVKK